MISDRQVRVANWLIEDGGEYVIDDELYYVNDEGEKKIRAYSVEIDGDLGGKPPGESAFHFGPIEWRRTYSEIDTEVQDRDIMPL
ncbi:hypothetical protein [Halobacterium salinarum]|uniref:hypothetical protein n=1 Tax=Halobacterium salinarum TaxID=2242 RepID=UPI002552860A|nr:hypothetical protein [Halobacterium salinarum]MDL0126634.1 hypothetical protein [Halobacterium salinarum]